MKSSSSTSAHDRPVLDRASVLYEAILGREIDSGARIALASQNVGDTDFGFSLAMQLLCSSEFMDKLLDHVIDAHLFLMHRCRQVMVRRLLPPAASIIDLGGINAPLFRMGYSHPFERMVIVDLPPEDRHATYRDIRFEASAGAGEASIYYCDMTSLEPFPDSSFDLVWSGQSIEHVEPHAASRMCREALRILRPGGHFCLDTPNRGITAIHTRPRWWGLHSP